MANWTSNFPLLLLIVSLRFLISADIDSNRGIRICIGVAWKFSKHKQKVTN